MIKTTECSPWVVQICSKQIQGGGRPPFWKKSQYLRDGLTDFNKIWQDDAARPAEPPSINKILRIRKSKMADGHHLEKSKKKINISSTDWPILTKCNTVIHPRTTKTTDIKQFENQSWQIAAILKNNKKLCYSRGTAQRACQYRKKACNRLIYDAVKTFFLHLWVIWVVVVVSVQSVIGLVWWQRRQCSRKANHHYCHCLVRRPSALHQGRDD